VEIARPLAPDDFELARPDAIDGTTSVPGSNRVKALPASSLPARAAGPSRRGAIRGQLRIAGTEDVLDEVLTVRLRMGDLSVKETVQSAPDGSFRTRRPFRRGFVLAEVLRPADDPAIECEAYFDPSSEEEWILPVPWPNFVRASPSPT
jgi:hypothetical protein